MEVFELVGASAIYRRLQASAAHGLTRFVGRETELETLTQALVRAATGHGQVIAVLGEAGVGKSRLVYEFLQSHRTQGWRVLESASVSYGKATPYFPVIDLLKRYAHVDEHEDTRTIRAKVIGHVLTLDATLGGILRRCCRCWGRCRRIVRFCTSIRRSVASGPLKLCKGSCCVRARCSPCCSSLRMCIGSTQKHRPCWTVWSSGCRRPPSAPRQLSPRVSA